MAGSRGQVWTSPGMTSKRIVPVPRLDGDPPQLRELGDRGLSAEAAVAGVLDPAEGHLRLVVDGGAVDVADAGVDALGDGKSAGDVAAEDGGGEAIGRVVGDADRLLVAPDAHHRRHRPEGLLLV